MPLNTTQESVSAKSKPIIDGKVNQRYLVLTFVSEKQHNIEKLQDKILI